MLKKIVLIVCILCLVTGVSMAKDAVILIPEDCTVENTKFSSGGGDSVFFYVEIFCTYPDGRQVLYMDTKTTLGGAFGIGRMTMPDKIKIIKSRKMVDEINFK